MSQTLPVSLNTASIPVANDHTSRLPGWLVGILALWLMLLVWSFVRTPIPAVNEPHYMTKARHFWNPEWCDRDFFLSSSNPHLFYYVTVGWLTNFCSLHMATLISRLFGLLIFAIGWSKLARSLVPGFAAAHLAMALFLLLQASVNFSGEWVIGGIESKVFSYGFGFWGIGSLLRKQPVWAGILLGLSIAYHPLVGLWLVLGLIFYALFANRFQHSKLIPLARHSILPAICLFITSLPGLWPALMVILDDAPAATKFAGDYLQVYQRLKHHLDPMEFEWWRYAAYAVMTVALLLSYRFLSIRNQNESLESRTALRLLVGISLAALLFAFVGVLVGLRFVEPAQMLGLTWRVKLLKFYPFRLYDLILPAVLAIVLTRVLIVWLTNSEQDSLNLKRQSYLNFSLTISLFVVGITLPFGDRNSSRMPTQMRQDWLAACHWIEQNTAEDALIVTPRHSWAFKWFAQRAEYVSYKDCPQESAGILEWNRRLTYKYNWSVESYTDEIIDEQDLARLAQETQAEYLIATDTGTVSVDPIFVNSSYRIFSLK
ncbi:DUF6798 domain-containing protein [Rubinisphaera sp.]|uniref:DUF6798 domain-containing protein n=1 Tax=Rubinisphaera sp. TaxID=2024857 RepID=UPI000C0FE873|nr:DUF6798 domain-containing protein [Rubinisphaera sp.]MBV09357.1 hypothetical protein [Rubinisphaera sp.]|tara:strand:- start:5437 stop:7068 length:1632 start_codon:yes stop_codon:yes gene_type:complete